MTLRRFLLIDSVLCDAAGVAALVAGAPALLTVVLFVLGALAFGGFFVLGRSRQVKLAA